MLNNKPLRNQNKGYIIIPRLPQGTNELQFNFSNPNFKPHKFIFDAGPKSLGLKLARVANNQFVLQDVVNNRIIKDVTQSNNNITGNQVVARKNESTDAVAKQSKAVTKRAKAKKAVIDKKETKKAKPITKTNSATANTNRRTYAMYRNRTPQTARTTESRYKNYRKINREKRRLKKKAQAVKSVAPKKIKPKKNDPKTVKKQKVSAEERERLLKLKRQKRIEEERAEYLALEKKRAERRAARAERRKQRIEEAKRREEADLRETKKVELRKKKPYDKENVKISEKIINAEPVGSPAVQKEKDKLPDNVSTTNRCMTTVRAEKVADWTTRLHKKYDDEARTNYIKRKLGSKCISNNNLGVLLANYETQIGRYKLIRTLFTQLENPNDMVAFQRYFQSQSYITKLKELRFQD